MKNLVDFLTNSAPLDNKIPPKKTKNSPFLEKSPGSSHYQGTHVTIPTGAFLSQKLSCVETSWSNLINCIIFFLFIFFLSLLVSLLQMALQLWALLPLNFSRRFDQKPFATNDSLFSKWINKIFLSTSLDLNENTFFKWAVKKKIF